MKKKRVSIDKEGKDLIILGSWLARQLREGIEVLTEGENRSLIIE